MATKRVADLTFDELREFIRREFVELSQFTTDNVPDDEMLYSDLSDFPVDDLGPWPETLLLHRGDM